MRGGRLAGVEPLLQLHGPRGERRGIRADDHHLVAERLDHPGVDGQRLTRRLHEALDGAHRRLVAALDGQAREAGQVGERDRDPQAALLEGLVAQYRPPCGRSCPARRTRPAGARADSSSAAPRAAGRRVSAPPAPRRSRRWGRPPGSAARGHTGGSAAPPHRRSGRSSARTRASAAGRRSPGSRRRCTACGVFEDLDVLLGQPVAVVQRAGPSREQPAIILMSSPLAREACLSV